MTTGTSSAERIHQLEAELAEAREALAAQRSLLDAVINHLPGAVSYYAPDLRIRFANEPFAARYGRRREDIEGKAIGEAFPPEMFPGQLDGAIALLKQVMASGEGYFAPGFPSTFVDDAGIPHERATDHSIVPILDETGAVSGLLALSLDATERARLSRALEARNADLERQQALLERIVGRVPAGIAYLDRDYVVRWLNPEYARALRRPAEVYIGRSIFDVAPGARASLQPWVDRVFATGEASRMEAYEHHATEAVGGPVTLCWDIDYVPVPGPDGRVEGVLIFAQEISERREREAALAREERKFRTLAENSPDVIARWDRSLRHVYVNPAAVRLTGIPAPQWLGQRHDALMPLEAAAFFQAGIQAVFDSGEPAVVEFQSPLDAEAHFHTQLTPEFDADGQVAFVQGVTRDISDRKRAEEAMARHAAHLEQVNHQLREADRIKDDFLSVISHELRTPLNFIMGFASIVDDEVHGPLNDRQHNALGKILTGADQMLRLVDDLLDYAKIRSGRLELAPAPTPYAPLIHDVLALMRPLADAKRLLLSQAVDVPGTPTLDGARVAQVLTNLLSNAIKFTPAGGEVRVRAVVRDGALHTEVADTGVGITEADRARLFERFQQLDMSRTREAGGTGLGLAICKALVEAHGGTIGVSGDPARGSTFWFTLPLSGPPA